MPAIDTRRHGGAEIQKNFSGLVDKATIDTENSTAVFRVTGLGIDREGEVVLPSAIQKRLQSYMDNPVVLWNHRRKGEPEDVLGITLAMAPVEKYWDAKFRFDTKINAKAKQCFDQVCADTLRSCSISFIPWAWVDALSPTEEIEALPEPARGWLKTGKCKTVYTDVEIIEITLTPVGSFREALKRSLDQEEECEDDMPAAVPGEVKSKGHAAANDISARLRSAASSLDGCYYYEDYKSEDLPPETRVTALIGILDDIKASLVRLLPSTSVAVVDAAAGKAVEKSAPEPVEVEPVVVSEKAVEATAEPAEEVKKKAAADAPPAFDPVAFADKYLDELLKIAP